MHYHKCAKRLCKWGWAQSSDNLGALPQTPGYFWTENERLLVFSVQNICVFLDNLIQNSGQTFHRGIDIIELIQAKQPKPKGHEVRRFIAR